MKIIEPNVELWIPENNEQHVARCARVCYRKETGNDSVLIKNLKNREHNSMFRHATYYFIGRIDSILKNYVQRYNDHVGFDYIIYNMNYYITVNGNWAIDFPDSFEEMQPFCVSQEEFFSKEVTVPIRRFTFKITTQISTSRELNRVSPNNIAEQSTRYVYEDGNICRPHWITKEEAELFNSNNDTGLNEVMNVYLNGCKRDFEEYKILVDKYKIHRQDARGILPLDTATVCVYTYNLFEWKHILDLRYFGITGAPHPNAKIIASMIYNKFKEIGYGSCI